MTALLVALVLAQATGCKPVRDAKGRIQRSEHVKNEFKKTHPCPASGNASGPCPGYVVDHIWPICAGGCDVVENMQWQTKVDAAKKDKLEWRMCRERGDDE
jgi:hypothetical protein